MFLTAYTYIEIKSNYHRGRILIFWGSFILNFIIYRNQVNLFLLADFYFAQQTAIDVDQIEGLERCLFGSSRISSLNSGFELVPNRTMVFSIVRFQVLISTRNLVFALFNP